MGADELSQSFRAARAAPSGVDPECVQPGQPHLRDRPVGGRPPGAGGPARLFAARPGLPHRQI